MPDKLDATTIQVFVALLTAVISLTSIIFTVTHNRMKEAADIQSRQEISRNILTWIGAALVFLGLCASLGFGLGFLFVFWIPAYILDCYLFLSNKNRETIRPDTFRLILSGQANIFMAILYYVNKFIDMHGSLVKALAEAFAK